MASSRSGAGKAGTFAPCRLRRAYAGISERHLRAGDRPHAEVLRRMRELERAVHTVVVCERERGIAELGGADGELLRQRGTVEKRVRRVRVQLDVGNRLRATCRTLWL